MNSIAFKILTDEVLIETFVNKIKEDLESAVWSPIGRTQEEASVKGYIEDNSVEIGLNGYHIGCKYYADATKTIEPSTYDYPGSEEISSVKYTIELFILTSQFYVL